MTKGLPDVERPTPQISIRSRTTQEIVDQTVRRATASYEALRTALLNKQIEKDVAGLHHYVLGLPMPRRFIPPEAIDRMLGLVTLSLVHGLDAQIQPTVPTGDLAIYELLRAALGRMQAENNEPVRQRYFAALVGKHEMTISKLCKSGVLPRVNGGIDPVTVRHLIADLDSLPDAVAE